MCKVYAGANRLCSVKRSRLALSGIRASVRPVATHTAPIIPVLYCCIDGPFISRSIKSIITFYTMTIRGFSVRQTLSGGLGLYAEIRCRTNTGVDTLSTFLADYVFNEIVSGLSLQNSDNEPSSFSVPAMRMRTSVLNTIPRMVQQWRGTGDHFNRPP